jgi:hypothetical protein
MSRPRRRAAITASRRILTECFGRYAYGGAGMMISRAALAAATALGLLAAPFATDAQQPRKLYRIGYLETGVVRPLPWGAFRS